MNFAQLMLWWLATLTLLCRNASAEGIEAAPRAMTYIGYASAEGSPRVFVETNEPVQTFVDRSEPDKVVLVLANTGILRRTNGLPLDTHFLPGPVACVQAKTIEDVSPSVRVEIALKRRVPFRLEKKGCEVAIVFDH